jgi:8-oxo-dGTP pyrophosphatase MutT (NUDIX family)
MDPLDDAAGAPALWRIEDDRLLRSCRVWDLRARRYRHSRTRKEGEFYYLDSRDWVIVVAPAGEGELIMIQQFRWGADALSWELPGGIVDDGEDPVTAGLRELREETGYEARRGRHIGRCRPNPAILNNYCHFVLAEKVTPAASGTNFDEHEEIRVCCLPEPTVMRWVREERITHALALGALFRYRMLARDEK